MIRVDLIRRAITALSDADLRREIRKLRDEHEDMREALIEYFTAETAYELESSTQSYGLYREACQRLIGIAKSQAEAEGKKPTKAKPRSVHTRS